MSRLNMLIKNNSNNMHYLFLALISLSIAIIITLLGLFIYREYKKRSERFKATLTQSQFLLQQRDAITKWIKNTEKRINRNNLKIKIKRYLIVSLSSFIIALIIGFKLFSNITAAVLFAVIFFIVPEYLISLYEDNLNKKIEEQLILALKYYTSESYKGMPMQKIMATISTRIGDPVGRYFSDCYYELTTGVPEDIALSELAGRFNTYYGKMFVQLIHQSRKNSNVIVLMTELMGKLEDHIELTRTNKSSIAGERLQAFIMAMLPIPAYIFMTNVFPVTEIFIKETYYGRLVITLSLLSVLTFILLDRFIRKV